MIELCVFFSTKDEALREYFEKFGKITRCSIKRDRDGKSRGFGHIIYESKHKTCLNWDNEHLCYIESSAVKDCIRLEPHTVDGNKLCLKVIRRKEKKEELLSSAGDSPPAPTTCQQLSKNNQEQSDGKIFVRGLRLGINEHNLRQYFSQFGEIRESIVVKHRDGSYKKGNV